MDAVIIKCTKDYVECSKSCTPLTLKNYYMNLKNWNLMKVIA
jgi:hypothetical protein